VAYTPDWEPLADALKRVMAAGIHENEAKTDLCRAVADRKIGVRVRIAATDYGLRGQVFSDGNVGVPRHLRPDHLDWVHSRPFAEWQIGPRPGEHYTWTGWWKNRVLDLIELSTGDVTKILCKGKRPHARPRLRRDERRPSPAANPARSQTTARPKRVRPAFERAHGVIETLYPKGVPDQAVEPNAILCRRVGAKLKESNMPDVSDDTILRAAGRRK
jgi:hypothetical protein